MPVLEGGVVISFTDSQLDSILDGYCLIVWGHRCGKTELGRRLVERWADRRRTDCVNENASQSPANKDVT